MPSLKGTIDRVYFEPCNISFNIENGQKQAIKSLKRDTVYDIDITEHKEKRSLTANAYYWVLLSKIAKALKLTMTEVHNQLLSEYGVIDTEIGSVILRDDIEWQKLQEIHLRPTTATRVLDNGKLYRVYFVIKGSHNYDTKQMTDLINGVVQEAKQLNIETLTPRELADMMKRYKQKVRANDERTN